MHSQASGDTHAHQHTARKKGAYITANLKEPRRREWLQKVAVTEVKCQRQSTTVNVKSINSMVSSEKSKSKRDVQSRGHVCIDTSRELGERTFCRPSALMR
jgi:hypothetical protein